MSLSARAGVAGGWTDTQRGAIPPMAAGIAAVLLAAVLARLALPVDPDTSWLILAAGRMLDGAIPYRDFVEANPPASILIYLPGVALARLLGIRPETVTFVLVAATVAGSLAVSLRALRAADVLDRAQVAVLAPLALAVLLVLPLYSYAQRDHIAAVVLLPSLACLALRAAGGAPRLGTVVAAALGAGLGVAIKPVFALALIVPVLHLMRQRGFWRTLRQIPELWLGAALCGLYAAAVALWVPAFADRAVVLLSQVYLPARTPLAVMVLLPCCWIWLGLMAGFWPVGGRTDTFGRVLALASAGFAAGFLVQGKGFGYQQLPAVLMAALACASALSRVLARDPARRTAALVRLLPAAVATFAALQQYSLHFDVARFAPGLTPAITASAGPAPRLLTIGGDMPMGNALARQVGAAWVGSASTTWVTYFARWITPTPERDPRFAALIADEQALYARDIVRARPDVLLIENDGLARLGRGAAWHCRPRSTATPRPAGTGRSACCVPRPPPRRQTRAPPSPERCAAGQTRSGAKCVLGVTNSSWASTSRSSRDPASRVLRSRP